MELFYDNVKKAETTSLGFNILSGTTNVGALIASSSSISNHSYGHGINGNLNQGLTIRSEESCLELISASGGLHAGSILIRDTSNDGFGFVNDPTNKELRLKSFTTSGNNFFITTSGSNTSRLDDCIVIKKDGSVSLFHDGVKRVETSSTGAVVTGILTATSFSGVTASQVNFVGISTGAVTRTVDSKLEEVVSVKDFGATGDGSTDDTAAIQAALNSAASVFFPKAKYRITSTLSQTVLNQKLYGNISRGNDLDAKIFLDSSSSSNGVINIRGPGTLIESLVLEGKGSTVANSYVIDANEEGFDSANNGNVDLTLINCNITDAKTLVKITGRGLQADSSSFVSYTNAIEFDWPSNFVAGSNPDQKLKTGMRAYGIRGCRFHGATSNFALKNVGSNAANIHGLQFTDNYIDTNTAIFQGHLHDSLFSSNVIIHSYPSVYPLFDIQGGSNFQINNNVFYGMDDNGAGTEEEMLGVAALTNCVGCQIDNNTINRVERDVVSINGTCSNISVSGNIMKNICLSNDGGTTRSPVRVNAAIDKLMVKNNIIDLTEITPSSWNKSEIIKNTGNYTITDHDVRGNMFDDTYWNLHNFPNGSTVGISTSDRNIERYDGDGTTSKTFTYAFKPLAVMAFNTNNNQSLMVSCNSDAGESSVDISGYNVIVKSNFNTNGQSYFLYVFQ